MADLKSQLTATEAVVRQREQARDAALAAAADPGEITVSPEAILDAPVRLPMTTELDDLGRILLRAPAELLLLVTGMREETEAGARRQLNEEQEREMRDKAVWLNADWNGNLTAIANPGGHPDVPSIASAPGPGAGQGISVSLVPRLGY